LTLKRPKKRINVSPACPHSKKTSLTQQQKKQNIGNFSLKDLSCFFFLMDKIEKEIDLWKENWGSPSIYESKLQAKLEHMVPSSILAYSSSVACVFYV